MKKIKIDFQHPFKLSKGGYFHLPLLSISFGRNGFALYLLGFSVAMSFNK